MGTWDTGPFDNDSAADFAGNIQDCTTPQARHDLLLMALQTGRERLQRTDCLLDNVYAWGWELEQAIAAAAFVADEFTSTKQFTDTPYARGVGEDMELKPFVEIQMSGQLMYRARLFIDGMIDRMWRDQINEEWIDPIKRIREAFIIKES